MKALKEKQIAYNCTPKISVAEYENMKRELTAREVKKLENSKEYRDFLMKKNLFGEKYHGSDGSESEKDE